jgi:hypothetical protein
MFADPALRFDTTQGVRAQCDDIADLDRLLAELAIQNG